MGVSLTFSEVGDPTPVGGASFGNDLHQVSMGDGYSKVAVDVVVGEIVVFEGKTLSVISKETF